MLGDGIASPRSAPSLTKAAQRPHIGVALLAAAQDIDGIEDLPIPARDDVARTVDFE